MVACAAQPFAFAQQPQAAAPAPAPRDPKALILFAAQSNGLSAQDAKPWHIKASFKIVDDKGNATNQGTFEEFWAGAVQYKRIFSSDKFTQTEFGTADGPRRTGANGRVPTQLELIAAEFLAPIGVSPENAGQTNLHMETRTAGTVKLTCLAAMRPASMNPPVPAFNEEFCLSENLPILRMHGPNPATRVLRNGIVKFQGQYLPGNIDAFFQSGLPNDPGHEVWSAHLENAEALQNTDAALFTPPPDAVKPPRKVSLTEQAARAQLLDHPKPVYPPIAVAARVSGNVVLLTTIAADGHVEGLSTFEGPPMLRQAAIDGVRKWTFKPFTDNGDSVSVLTVMTVHFQIDPVVRVE